MSREKSPTRHRILQSAWQLLEAGDSAVRMADIAKTAGISRQALYLHFPNRADLLIATTRYIDEVKVVDAMLAESRAAIGVRRLDSFIAAWGNYIPEIQGVARALRAMQATDAEAHAAWENRMRAVREGCAAAVGALAASGELSPTLDAVAATDLLWALMSVETWERLVLECGWPQETYIARMTALARDALTNRAA